MNEDQDIQLKTRMTLGRHVNQTLPGIKTVVSDIAFSRAFHQHIDRFHELLRSMSPNFRPAETTEQVLDIFCQAHNCVYRFDYVTGEHTFTKGRPRDWEELKRYATPLMF